MHDIVIESEKKNKSGRTRIFVAVNVLGILEIPRHCSFFFFFGVVIYGL